MSHEAAYHDGYKCALEDLGQFVEEMDEPTAEAIDTLLEVIQQRIEKARCLSHSCLAAGAAGSRGY